MTISPVLLIIFNRPEPTQQVLDVLRKARPARLYIAADGPRPDRPGEAEKCAAARQVALAVDWPCDVKTLFQDTNLGCRQGVSTAITWFFDNEEEGIILEDDIVPDPTFFRYCTELLEHYRDEPRVMAITGLNLQPANRRYDHSYYFSCYNHVWGWASWRRAWSLYDRTLDRIESDETRATLHRLSPTDHFHDYWMEQFRAVRDGRIDTWDYSWLLTCWMHNGLTCTPNRNLIRNIGFGEGATHTHDESDKQANLAAGSLSFPLSHPTEIKRSPENDDHVTRYELGIKPQTLRRRLTARYKAWRKRKKETA